SVATSAANKPTSTAAKEKDDNRDEYTKNLPKPGPDPTFALPAIEKTKLSNGLNVWIVKQSELPIVSMNMVLNSGGTFDPKDRAGLASFTASLLDSGTQSRSAEEIANELQAIGANLRTGSGWDSANISLQTLTKNIDKALDLYSDIVLHPSFPESELETLRKRALVSLLQRKDNPNAIANVAYSALLYGKDHPYGHSLGGDEKSVSAITRDEIEKFYGETYHPNNATLIIVGDTDAKTLMPKLEKAFGKWEAGDAVSAEPPMAKAFDEPGIYIVDKPGAAQSVISIGQIGVPRNNPDYFPLMVMNSILGGQFTSRVNMNLREDKGYTYGARTSWAFRKGAGPFEASAGAQTAVTKESVVEFMKELNGIRGDIPLTDAELDYSKQSLIR